MAEKYTFLFVTNGPTGQVYPCIAIGEKLLEKGHSVVFATPAPHVGKLGSLGFREEAYPIGEEWTERMSSVCHAFGTSTIEVLKEFLLPGLLMEYEIVESARERFKEIMTHVKPHVVIVDNLVHNPYIQDQGVPWVRSVSWNPIGISRLNVPLPFFGLPTEGSPTLWNDIERDLGSLYGEFMQGLGNEKLERVVGPSPNFSPLPITLSPYANIYNFPLELDYTTHRPVPPNCHRVDSLMRDCETHFQIPAEIRGGQGKLIYFSMGTIGCGDVELMKRLVAMLTQSPHRFIISKGPLGDSLELGPNMWGAKVVPQTRVIPLVDLVITHGGNNTLTESFYHGKRVLVLPIFGDQLDNGQRVTETGLGLHFHPYKVTQAELLEGIELVLGDELLERRMRSIGQRIRADKNDQGKAADVIIGVALAQGQIAQNP